MESPGRGTLFFFSLTHAFNGEHERYALTDLAQWFIIDFRYFTIQIQMDYD
jgi:hypothetical protein